MTMLSYFDPGNGSLLMQALVGGVAGLAVFGRYLWECCAQKLAARRRQDS